MKIIFDQEELLYGVSLASRVVPSKYPVPAVTGLYLKTIDSDSVEIVGNDMELSLKITIKARVEEPGEAVLPSRFLADIVRRLPAGEVTFTMPAGEFTARLEVGSLHMELGSMNPVDYPAPPLIAMDEMWRAPQKALREAIHSVDFAISKDESRPAMTGMLLVLSPEGCRVVAMDGFRFAERKLPLSSPVEHECIIPGKAISDLVRLLADNDEPFEAQISSNHISLRFERLLFQSRLIEAPFPFKSAQELIRKEPTTQVRIDRKALIGSIERALLVTREDAKGSNIIRLNFEDRQLTISSNSPDLGKLTEQFDMEIEGENLLIGFNGRYLLDILNVIKEDTVHIQFSGPLTAAVIKPVEASDFVTILSPIRLAQM